MNYKTERSEIPSIFRPWLLFFTLATIAIVFLTPGLGAGKQYQVNKQFQITLFPWIQAGQITISNGLEAFSGIPANPPSDGQRATILVSLLLTFVAGPTLLLVGWRQWKTSPVARRWHPPALLLGAVIVASTAVPSSILAVRQWQVVDTMRKTQSSARERDLMVHAIHLVGRDARQFRILPASSGGGGGTFRGYEIPSGLRQGEFFSCDVPEVADTMITLRALSSSGTGLQVTASMSRSGVMRLDFQEPEG